MQEERKMKTRFKKITSVFLSFLMVVYLFPFGAFAETAGAVSPTAETEEYTVYRYQDETCSFTEESWPSGTEKTITDEYTEGGKSYFFAVQDSVGNVCMDEVSVSTVCVMRIFSGHGC
jgi:hypothetical protein